MKLLTRLQPLFASKRLLPVLLAITALLTLPALFTGYFGDDHFFRAAFADFPGLPEFNLAPHQTFQFFAERDPAVRQARLERGGVPWWAGPEMSIAFMRPLSSLSHWLDYRLFNDTAWPAHIHSNLWFLGTVLLAALLYRRLLPLPWLAGLAAALYALDEAHALSIAWLSARNGLLTTFFGLATLLAHDQWRGGSSYKDAVSGSLAPGSAGERLGLPLRRQGVRGRPSDESNERSRPRAWALPLSLAALVLGLASGEAAVGVAGFLFAYAVCLEQGNLVRKLMTLLPYGVVFVVWALIYRHYGFGVKNAGTYADPVGDPLRFAQFAVVHLPVLFVSQFGLPDSTAFNFLEGPAVALYWLGAMLGVSLFAWLLWPLLRESKWARFWALGMLVSALPSAAVAPQDRLLGLSGVGVMALVALFLGRVLERKSGPRDRWQRVGTRAVPAALGIHLILAPLLLPAACYFMVVLPELGAKKADASVPEAGIEDLSVVMINAPSDVMNVAVLVLRSAEHRPLPRNCWLLTATNRDVQVLREDERTLVVTAEGGYLDKPWADRYRVVEKEPMPPGTTVELSRMRAEVVEVLEDGRPLSVRFTFDRALEDSSLHLVAWRDNDFFPFTPPAVGERVVIPGLDMGELLPELFSTTPDTA